MKHKYNVMGLVERDPWPVRAATGDPTAGTGDGVAGAGLQSLLAQPEGPRPWLPLCCPAGGGPDLRERPLERERVGDWLGLLWVPGWGCALFPQPLLPLGPGLPLGD